MPAVYLLDTNAISDLMMDQPKMKAKVASQPGRLITSVVACGEIRYGLERLPPGKRRDDLKTKADLVLAAVPCEPVPAAAADIYATTRYAVEGKGLAIDDNDLWIAATTVAIGAVLVSRDQDFTQIPGLPLEDWTQ